MKNLLEMLVEKEINRKAKIIQIIKETQVLAEAGLSRVVGKYFELGFIVISAERSCEAEKGRECTPEEEKEQEALNKENEKQLRRDIASYGYGYIPSFGGFREEVVDPETGETRLVDNPNPEKSFIIPAKRRKEKLAGVETIEHLKQVGMLLSQKYNQDSFFLKNPGKEDKTAYFITKTGEEDMKFDNFTVNDMEQIYFTQLRKRPGRFSSLEENQKFVLFIPKTPKSFGEAKKRYGEYFFRVEKQK